MNIRRARSLAVGLLAVLCAAEPAGAQSNWTLLGWNNLGMHCMDSDYTVFSILPPYNTINAQLINGQGKLVTNLAGLGVTYRAIADPEGSFNATSLGKGNFWSHAQQLFGVALAPDVGLPVPGPASYAMPGSNNVPQGMGFEPAFNWLVAYGIPIAPYDDAGRPNQYPMMRLVATNTATQVVARVDVVLPVSDEMDCKLCHASGAGPDARPAAGWVADPDPGRDYRLNILRLHDERQLANPAFQQALVAVGFNTNGLFATVTANRQPILCAACHLSEALPGSGQPGLPPLTEAMHGGHAPVLDPRNGLALNASANRLACYSCHPGSVTRCLRGAMGKAVAPDGSMEMQCQSCHGHMSDVGSTNRIGWLHEPTCQACHVGGANNSYRVIRFLDAMTNGALRTTTDLRFATQSNAPAAGLSLYRFSKGHGGLQCSACHGSTHAEYPTSHRNDNIASIQIQGHAGVVSECTACHQTMPATTNGGPHGMHSVGQAWLTGHQEAGRTSCRACHGTNSIGTVLSRAFADRTITTKFGTKNFWRGYQIGCYDCHDGPNSEDATTKGFPVVTNQAGATTSGVPVAVDLGTARVRLVSPPGHGAVALSNQFATYVPDAGFVGVDVFTFCATNDYNDSNLGTVTITVHPAPAPPPQDGTTYVFALDLSVTGAHLGVATTLDGSYILQGSDTVEGPWSNVTGVVWGRTDTKDFTDPAGAEGAHRFYRSVLQPTNPAPALVTADSATNGAYDSGWHDGDNGGGGWGGGWSLTTFGSTNAGFFVGTTAQANMSLPPRAWGLWAKNGATAQATRPFARAWAVRDALSLRFDNNWISTGSSVGLGLQNAAGDNLLEVLFVGGQATYLVNDAQSGRVTPIPWTGNGMDVAIRLVAEGQYSLTCGSYEVGGALRAFADMNIVRLKIWNYNAGPDANYDLYVNDLRLLSP